MIYLIPLCLVLLISILWASFSPWRNLYVKIFERTSNSLIFFRQKALVGNQEFLSISDCEKKQFSNAEFFALETLDEAMDLYSKNLISSADSKIYKLKDYFFGLDEWRIYYKLNSKLYPIKDLMIALKQELILAGCSSVSFNTSNFKFDSVRCDITILIKVFARFAKEFYNIIYNSNPGESIDAVLAFNTTQLDYIRDFDNSLSTKNVLRSEPALSITLLENLFSQSADRYMQPVYTKSLSDLGNIGEYDIEFQDIIRGIDEQYGLYEICEDSLFWKCIIPVDIDKVRPSVLDLSEPTNVFYNYPEADVLENKFLTILHEDFPDLSLGRINKAIDVIKKYHFHQKRNTGEPFYMHLLSVGVFLLKFIKVEQSEYIELLKENIKVLLVGALLHDILEDTFYSNKAVLANFGHEVYKVVVDVTKFNVGKRSVVLANTDVLKTLIFKDPISLTVKLLDRYHNLLTIAGHKSLDKRRFIAQETLDFCIVPAERYHFMQISKVLKLMCNEILKTGTLDPSKYTYLSF